MASFADISIRFRANLKQFSTQMQNAERRMKKVGKRFENIGQNLTLGVTLPVLGLGAASVKAASDAEETSAKFNTVFRDISEQAKKASETLVNSYGQSQQASQELLSNTGDLLTGFGFTQDSALELSTEVNKLAVDLASFTNFSGGAKGASEALTKALLGERESVKSLGISILEADVQAKMLKNSQEGLTFETERQAKAFATLQLAQEQSQNAIGDYARTSDSFANTTRKLRARLNDLGVEFGKILLPLAQKLADVAGKLITYFRDLSPETKKVITVVAGLAAAIGPLLTVIGLLATTVVPGLISTFVFMSSTVIPSVIAAFKTLTAAMIANPFGAVAAALGLAVSAFYAFNDETEETIKKQSELEKINNKVSESVAREKAEVSQLLSVARDETASKEAREEAIRGLNKISPEYLGNLKLETINTDKARKSIEKYNNSLLRSAKIKVAQEQLQKIAKKRLELELSREKKVEEAKKQALSLALKNKEENVNLNEVAKRANNILDGEIEKLKEKEKAILDVINAEEKGNKTGQQVNNGKGSSEISSVTEGTGLESRGIITGAVGQMDADLAKYEKQKEKFSAIGQAFKKNAKEVGNAVAGAFNNFTNSFISSLELADSGFQGFVKNMAKTITDLISILLSNAIANAITGASQSALATGPGAVFAQPAFISTAVGGILSAFAAIPKFADGGIVSGETVGIMGEYSGARTNPEVIAPLDKLKSMIGDAGGAQRVVVEGRLSGQDILLSNQRAGNYRNRRS